MIVDWNVRGIKSRRLEVKKCAELYDIILLQKTLLKSHDDYELLGFIVLCHDERRHPCGHLRQTYGISFAPDCSSFNTDDRDVQVVSVSDEGMTRDLNTFNFYVSKASAEQDWDFLHHSLGLRTSCIVAGDYNQSPRSVNECKFPSLNEGN